MDKCNDFLEKYYAKVKKEIEKEYDKKLAFAKENSDLNRALSDIKSFVESSYGFSNEFMQTFNNGEELRFKIDSYHFENESGDKIQLTYSKCDEDELMKIANEKSEKIDKLTEEINNIKMLLSTVGSVEDFRNLLTTYGILDKDTGRLK